LDGSLHSLLQLVACVLVAISLLTFIVPLILQALPFQQDLKRKYKAKWAVVTGGSSGIGRALSEKLASQGINVVIVALKDQLLDELHSKLQAQYPQLEFRAVGVDLSGSSGDYMQAIAQATEDIDVSLLFNNAGYITIGLFAHTPLEQQLKNYEVNATSAVKITHHFVRRMIDKKLVGAVSFTSSPAGLMPCPFSVVYGSTKAFLTEFATSLAGEVKSNGIDVFVLHPSPVNTNFYSGETAHKSSALNFFKKTANSPDAIADTIFRSIGYWSVVRDQGYFSVGLRLLLKVIDINFLTLIITLNAHRMGEYKNLMAERRKKD